MKYRDQFARLSKLQESGDNEECWKEFYTEDVVRRFTGRNECQPDNLFQFNLSHLNILKPPCLSRFVEKLRWQILLGRHFKQNVF